MPAVGKSIGFSDSTISRWLDGKYGGDVESLEEKLKDMLDRAAVRDIDRPKTVRNSVTREFAAHADRICQSNHFGLIAAASGVGKTTALALYQREHPNCLAATMTTYARDDRALFQELLAQLGASKWNQQTALAGWVMRELRGSNRLIVVDNAHNLTHRAIGALFDLHDLAGVPVCLVAEPEIVAVLKIKPRWFSRVGYFAQLTMTTASAAAIAARHIAFYAPAAPDGLTKLAVQVILDHGHGRIFANQLRLAAHLKDGDARLRGENAYTWPEAFAEAGKDMVKNAAVGEREKRK